jgi:hypothetical protein
MSLEAKKVAVSEFLKGIRERREKVARIARRLGVRRGRQPWEGRRGSPRCGAAALRGHKVP